ncbi:MAG: Rpn family recombination-promoting nuclease/putative transposase, partial [Bacteroidales bacterium]|nr:Rpn family recombination-promoting nuclease/putative transposase [Bacteroidales bacterium]
EFFSRTIFNAASMYTKQLEKGNPFERLKEVYALALVNDEAFDYEGDDGYMQEFYITNKNHPDDRRRDLSFIFVELVKYKPKDRGSRAIKELWLRFLTEIDESTKKADDVLLENPEINQALEILETSAYTDADLYVYNDALLEIMTQRNAMKNERAEGYAEGEYKKAFEIAKKMLSDGMPIDLVAKYSGLTSDEIAKI